MATSGLGNLLVEEGLLTEDDRRTIRRASGTHGSAFARSILALGLMNEDELAAFIAERSSYRMAGKDLLQGSDKNAIAAIDQPLLARLDVVPLKLSGSVLTVAMADPLDMDTRRQLEFFTGYKVKPVIATFTQIRAGLEKIVRDYKPLPGQLESFLINHAVAATRRQRLNGTSLPIAAPRPHSAEAGAAAADPSPVPAATGAPANDTAAGTIGDDLLDDDDSGSFADPDDAASDDSAFGEITDSAINNLAAEDDLESDDSTASDVAGDELKNDALGGGGDLGGDLGSDLGDDLLSETADLGDGLGDETVDADAAPAIATAKPQSGAKAKAAASSPPGESLADLDLNDDLSIDGDIDDLFGDEGDSGKDPFAESDAAAAAAAEGTDLGANTLVGEGDGLGSDEIGGDIDLSGGELDSDDTLSIDNDDPVGADLAVEDPTTDDTIAGSLTTDDLTTDDMTTDDLTTDDLTTDDLTTDDLTTDDLTTDDLTTDDLTTDDMTAGMTTEGLTTENLAADDMTAGMTTDDLTTESMTADSLTTDDLTTDDMTVEDLADAEPMDSVVPAAHAIAANRALVAISMAADSDEAARLATPAMIASGLRRGVVIALPARGQPRALCSWQAALDSDDAPAALEDAEQLATPNLATALHQVDDHWCSLADQPDAAAIAAEHGWQQDGGGELLACIVPSASGGKLAVIVAADADTIDDEARQDSALTVLRSLARAC